MTTPKKISRTIFKVSDLILKLHVRLSVDKNGVVENFHRSFTNDSKEEYITLDLPAFITFEYKDFPNEWARDKSIVLTGTNLVQLIRGLKILITRMSTGEMFAMTKDTKEIIAYSDKVKENIVVVDNLGNNQIITMIPSVVYDDENVSYEGATFFINRKEYALQLTIDQIDALYYMLQNIDIFTYSQLMVNYFVASQNGNPVQPVTKTPVQYKKKHPFDNIPPMETEMIKSTLSTPPPLSDTFGGLSNMTKGDD